MFGDLQQIPATLLATILHCLRQITAAAAADGDGVSQSGDIADHTGAYTAGLQR